MTAPPLSRSPLADRLAKRSLTASAALHDELLLTLRRGLGKLPAAAPQSDLFDVVIRVLSSFANPLAKLLGDANLAAWLVGAGEAAGGLPPSWPPGLETGGFDWDGSRLWLPLVHAAVADLKRRDLVTKEQWEELSDEARADAFTVANLETTQAVGQVRDALAEATAEGTGFPAWRKAVEQAVGEGRLGMGHMELIFRVGTGKAVANGKEEIGRLPVVLDVFPYRQRQPITDTRLTELCEVLARSGIQGTAIYRAADPVWRRTRPLSHWQCRCNTRLMTTAEAAEKGLSSAQQWIRTGEDPLDFVPMPRIEELQGYSPQWSPD